MSRIVWTEALEARLLACDTDAKLSRLASRLGVNARWLKGERTRRTKANASGNNDARFGLISRIDYPSDNFRRGLLDLAARDFASQDVQFVVLAGGLVNGAGVRVKSRQLKIKINATNKELLPLYRQKDNLKSKIRKQRDIVKDQQLNAEYYEAFEPEEGMTPAKVKAAAAKAAKEATKARAAVAAAQDEIRRHQDDLEELQPAIDEQEKVLSLYENNLEELEPENLAERLAELLPVFRNRSGEMVKLHIHPSSVYDTQLGIDVMSHLLELRPDDVRVYENGGGRMSVKDIGVIQVLVPTATPWRSKYYSTPAERLIEDFKSGTSKNPPNLFVTGCFASTITKPEGEVEKPYVTAPALHRLSQTSTKNENQIGARVVTMVRDQQDPITRNYSYKDRLLEEYRSVKLPRRVQGDQRKVVRAIINYGGAMPASLIAETTGLDRRRVDELLAELRNRPGNWPTDWPGVTLNPASHLWDLDQYWLRENLTYPDLPENLKVDSVLAIGCPHFGSVYTDLPFFLEAVPRAILEHDVDTLVMAGDLIEGLKHGLAVKGEVIGGMNVTAQEELAGRMLAKVILEATCKRLDSWYAGVDNPSTSEVRQAIIDLLLTLIIIAGNHDEWSQEFGFTPLVTLKSTLRRELERGLTAWLFERGMWLRDLPELVESKVVEPVEGEFFLPSGLKAMAMHPHMGRAQTTSTRPQQALAYARHCQAVFQANFHVAMHVQTWAGDHGERVCLELGTLKRRTSFEHRKMKIVDFGFGVVVIQSADGRIVQTGSQFYSAPETKDSMTKSSLAYDTLVERYQL